VQLNRNRVGRIFLWIGIVAWFPYGIMKYGLGRELPVWPFLAWHLVGVIPGSLILRWRWIRALGRKTVAK
jgi:hypothetical protein